MKLYATTTSERATKGQGGNEYLEINIQIEHPDGTREELGTLEVFNEKEYRRFSVYYTGGTWDTEEEKIDELEYKEKAKK